MSEEKIDDLTRLWQKAKVRSEKPTIDINSIVKAAEARKKKMLATHYGNAAVLSATVIILAYYFYYLYDFQDLLSKIGYQLMIIGLTVRIAIEFYSIHRSKKVKVSDPAANSLHHSVAFYEFRKRINGPVTQFIFVLYFIGFYMLTPEFSRHFSIGWMISIDGSALIIAGVLIYFIRKGIRQELEDLKKMVALHRSLLNE